ncbi:unnamed protein product [Orchesella dallaii]|uniref:Uncharacterized protein n=1 Tax=Orchesella dallaii TaxID=48710 RepID=A0ABP1RKE2_9HEXA
MARVQGTGFAVYSFRSIKRCNKLQSEIISKADQMEREVEVKPLSMHILESREEEEMMLIYRKCYNDDLNKPESKLKGMKESLAMVKAKMAEVVPGEEFGDMTEKD